MASVKITISLQRSFLDQVDELAQKLEISRSRLFVMATEEFIKRHKAEELIMAIDDEDLDPERQMFANVKSETR